MKFTLRKGVATAACVVVTASGCTFDGVTSLPLPGAVGTGKDATAYRVQLANVGTLEPNSPVMTDDVVVGSVRRISVVDRHAEVEVSIKPGVVIPANAVASVGQTSLLGSMHLQLNAPLGAPPAGQLTADSVIPLSRSSTYPSTERTLAALSAVVNSGGLGQIGDIIHNFNQAFSGRQDQVRELIGQLDTFVGALHDQRDSILDLADQMARLSSTLAGQQSVIARALREIPPALEVLINEEPRFTTALDRLRVFSDTATGLITETQDYLVRNLQNLEPTFRALADIGPDLAAGLGYATVFPMSQNLIDRGIRGDYMNLFVTVDLTKNRLKRGLAAGTRWGDPHAPLVPAPGDFGYDAFYGPGTVPPDPLLPFPHVPPPAPEAPTDGGG